MQVRNFKYLKGGKMGEGDSRSILDTELLGFNLRRARQKAGYEKAEDLVEALANRLNYSVSKQTIYNVESGKQEPKLSLYLALMRLLHPDDFPMVDPFVVDALPPRWRVPLLVAEKLDVQSKQNESDEATNDSAKLSGLTDAVRVASTMLMPEIHTSAISAAAKALAASASAIDTSKFVSAFAAANQLDAAARTGLEPSRQVDVSEDEMNLEDTE